ncbi:MAG: glycosyltransferase family 4 protein, partial [Acidimicrobiales bacterium]
APERARCRAYAESFFGWPDVVRRHVSVYRQAMHPAAPKPRVVFLDHCAQLSGGELALLRLLPALDEIEAHVILAEDGPLVSRLLEAGISVEVLPLDTEAQRLGRHRARPGGVPARALVASGAHVLRLARRLRRLRPDIVHTNSLKATVYGGFAARLAGVPVIFHIRDRIADDYLPASTARALRLFARHVPAAVIANSATTLATLGRPRLGWTVIPSPIGVSLNGAEPRGRSGTQPRLRSGTQPSLRSGTQPRWRSGTQPLRIGIVGRLAPWKGQHVFLEAFARAFPSGGADAVIVGSALFGEDDYARRLESDAAELGLDARVEFRGFREDIEHELSRLDVLVHASTVAEPFGQVVVEGMAVGLPVVASGAGGPAEVVEDGVTGLLYPPSDVAALAARLERLAGDPALRQALGDAARRRARDFQPDRVAPQVMAVYRRVAIRSSHT